MYKAYTFFCSYRIISLYKRYSFSSHKVHWRQFTAYLAPKPAITFSYIIRDFITRENIVRPLNSHVLYDSMCFMYWFEYLDRFSCNLSIRPKIDRCRNKRKIWSFLSIYMHIHSHQYSRTYGRSFITEFRE